MEQGGEVPVIESRHPVVGRIQKTVSEVVKRTFDTSDVTQSWIDAHSKISARLPDGVWKDRMAAWKDLWQTAANAIGVGSMVVDIGASVALSALSFKKFSETDSRHQQAFTQTLEKLPHLRDSTGIADTATRWNQRAQGLRVAAAASGVGALGAVGLRPTREVAKFAATVTGSLGERVAARMQQIASTPNL